MNNSIDTITGDVTITLTADEYNKLSSFISDVSWLNSYAYPKLDTKSVLKLLAEAEEYENARRFLTLVLNTEKLSKSTDGIRQIIPAYIDITRRTTATPAATTPAA